MAGNCDPLHQAESPRSGSPQRSYLFVQSQGIIPLLSDPLGKGWHLLPTADYKPSFALAQAKRSGTRRSF